MLSFGIYYRKFIFFGGLVILAIFGLYFYSQQFSQASVKQTASSALEGNYNSTIQINENGTVTINGKKFSNLIHPQKDYDEFRYLVADNPKQYINSMQLTVNLPSAVSKNNIQPIIYAIHGVGYSNFYFSGGQSIVYNAQNIGPYASLTIVAKLPKGMIKFPFWRNVWFYLNNVPLSVWLTVSLILPLGTLLILFLMFIKTNTFWHQSKTKALMNQPPANLAPAIAGVLINGRVSAASIAATLVDLAHRDYINIVNYEKTYTFGKKKNFDSFQNKKDQDLKPFESLLLSKIFTPQSIKSTEADIQVRVGHHVFSRKIAEVYISIYNDVTNRKFFTQNPSAVYLKYKKIGLFLFFLSLIGFIFGIFLAPDPKYLLFFWVAAIFSSLIIIRITPQFPTMTSVGLKEREKWLGFKNFLETNSAIDYQGENQELFERYLPYAIAFGCEAQWARRFLDSPFRNPDWYVTSKPVIIFEDFITGLFPVISYLGDLLAGAKEPVVE